MRRALLALLALAVAGAVVFYLLTMPPVTEPASALPAHTPDLANGKYMFTAGGCAECHAVPVKTCDDLKTKDKETLVGGRCLNDPVRHLPRAEHLAGQGDRHRQLDDARLRQRDEARRGARRLLSLSGLSRTPPTSA